MKAIKKKGMGKEEKVMHRLTIDLDDATWEAFKIKAVKERSNMKAIIVALIKDYIKRG